MVSKGEVAKRCKEVLSDLRVASDRVGGSKGVELRGRLERKPLYRARLPVLRVVEVVAKARRLERAKEAACLDLNNMVNGRVKMAGRAARPVGTHLHPSMDYTGRRGGCRR